MKNNGYSYKNYLIDSAWKSVRGAGMLSMMIASIPQTAFWVFVVGYMDNWWQLAIIILPASVLLWVGVWWAMFDRLITYTAWVANYREMYEVWEAEQQIDPPPPPQPSQTVYNQLDGTTHVIDRQAGRVGGDKDKRH